VKFRHHQLSNGLELIAECSENAYSAGFAFFVKTGSRDESDEISGVSHFLEHMVFKGSPKRSAADVNRELDELSSHSNAYTGEEQTVYYAVTLPEDQDPMLDLLADMMRPALRQDDFDTEKNVILEEIAKYEDQPPYNAYEKCQAALLGDHPLSRTILGTPDSVQALQRDQMLTYFEQRYSPKNIVLAGSGNVDFEKMIASAEQLCGHWKPFSAPRTLPPASPRTLTRVYEKEQATQEYVVQTALAPAANDDDRYAARVLATIIGDESGSRLFWELVDSGLAEHAAMGAYEYQDIGLFVTSLSCMPDQAAENLERIQKVLADVEKNGVTQAELDQTLNKICAHIILQAERPSSRLFSIGSSWIQRRQYKTVRETVERYRALTLRDLARVVEKYPLRQSATVAIGPLKEFNGSQATGVL
jgi:predicted Zn-dependent peptidase